MLDPIDRKILRSLQEDGRITNQELASRCSLSPSACHERTRRLRDQGYIKGFTALLNPALLGQSLTVFIEVLLERTDAEGVRSFGDAVAKEPRISECYMIAGA